MTQQRIAVIGAGVLGLWAAYVLAKRGHMVRLVDRSVDPLATSASSYAGAMLAPYCEAEAAPAVVLDLGRGSVAQWSSVFPGTVVRGTLVVAAQRDRAELSRFAAASRGHRACDARSIAELEPSLAGRFATGLFYAEEAHLDPRRAMAFLLDKVRELGGEIAFGEEVSSEDLQTGGDTVDIVVDCRGLGAQCDIGGLRGVRGERVIVSAREVQLSRPVRLLHPRHPIYIVPWGDDLYMVGATVIESEDDSAPTVRSLLELLGAAYAVDPAFAEAEVVTSGAGVRPAFDDNVPRLIVEASRRSYRLNGAYRHGFLLAPELARCLADHIGGRQFSHPLVVEGAASRSPLRRGGEVI